MSGLGRSTASHYNNNYSSLYLEKVNTQFPQQSSFVLALTRCVKLSSFRLQLITHMLQYFHLVVNLQKTHRRHGDFCFLSTFCNHFAMPSPTPDEIDFSLFVVKLSRKNWCVLPAFFFILFKLFLKEKSGSG